MYIDSTTTLTVEEVKQFTNGTLIEFANGASADVSWVAQEAAQQLQPGQSAEFTFDKQGLIVKIVAD